MHLAGRRALVMGIVNVTPDSFYDGGRYADHDRAIVLGGQQFQQGADVVDVGGESSRPGARSIPVKEESRRVLPVIEALASQGRVSIDTVKPEVAAQAVEHGASLVNDVSGSLWPVAAELGVGWVAMHRKGTPATMQRLAYYDDVVQEVSRAVIQLAARAKASGVREVWIDPGIGFAKDRSHNLELLGHLRSLVEVAAEHGHGVLVGTSRKSFLGALGQGPRREPLPANERLAGSLATAVWGALQGAGMVRVHDVVETVRALQIVGSSGAAGDGAELIDVPGESDRSAMTGVASR